MSQVACTRCGAGMIPQADGRTYHCQYCNATQQVAVDASQIAAGIAADLANIDAFLHRLALALSQGFADRSRITANGNVVHAIEVRFDEAHFVVTRQGQQVVAQQKKVVRGVALKTKTVPLDHWYQELTAALAHHASSNAGAASLLAQLGRR